MKYLIAAVAAGCLLCSGTVSAKDRETVQLRLSPAGEDLSDQKALAAFRAQAMKSISQVCNPGDRLGADMAPDWQCRREMTATLDHALKRVLLAMTSSRG